MFQLTRQNLSILGLPLEIQCVDYVKAIREPSVPADQLLVVFVAPPWGNALDSSDGLDLRCSTPPASEIVDLVAQRFPNPMLFAIQVYEKIVSASLAALTPRFDWSALRTYEFNAAGHNHGLLLGARGWPSLRPGSADR